MKIYLPAFIFSLDNGASFCNKVIVPDILDIQSKQ